jgi:hypothetical protein
MIEGFQTFNFKINLSDDKLSIIYKDLYDHLSRLIASNYGPFTNTGRSFESFGSDSQKYILGEMIMLIQRFIHDNGGSIPFDSDDNNIVSFSLKKDNFKIVKVSGKEGKYEIILSFKSECIKIEGIIGNKFLFRSVNTEGETPIEDDHIFFINSDKISFLSKYNLSK